MQNIGRYLVRSLLGDGGMGAVYRASDPDSGALVAIKVLHPHVQRDESAVRRFRAEAAVQATLSHPNIVKVLDVVDGPGGTAIVMEYVDGKPLDRTIAERGSTLPLWWIVRVLLQVLAAAGHAHSRRLVHRDIKPSNIIVNSGTQGPIAKLTDFGIVKVRDATRYTTTGSTLGTLAYMSPEHLRNPRAVDARADIYAIGATGYHLLTGSLPFGSDSDYGLMSRILNDSVPRPSLTRPDVPPALEAVVMRALEKDPRRRFATCEEMSAALQASLGPHPAPPRLDRRRAAAAALACGGVLFMLLAAAVAIGLAPRGRQAEPADVRPRQRTEVRAQGPRLDDYYPVSEPEAERGATDDWQVSLLTTEVPSESPDRAESGPVDSAVGPWDFAPGSLPKSSTRIPEARESAQTLAAPSRMLPPRPAEPDPAVPAGTVLRVRLRRPVSSEGARPGDQVPGVLATDVIVGGRPVISAGVPIVGRVEDVVRGDHFTKRGRFVIRFDAIETTEGRRTFVSTSPLAFQGAPPGGAGRAIGGAFIGALIGREVAGKQGTASGALAGVAAGLAASERSVALLQSGTELSVTLTAPLIVVAR